MELNEMKHESSHKLDVACLDCIRVHLEHKRRLLNFVRDIEKVNINASDHILAQLFINSFHPLSKIILNQIEADNDT
jgi:hypothetical protein